MEWNLLARWFLNGMAAVVLAACEQAVVLAPESGNYRDSRGLARALTGDLRGAIADFEFAVQQWQKGQGKEALIQQREQWLAALKTENPIHETDAGRNTESIAG